MVTQPRGVLAAAVLALALASGSAKAQTSPADAAAAQALFDDAKSLMKAGHYDQACPKLEESQRLDAGGGTLVALALCYEALGRTGSAWATWNAALSGARSEHRPDREAMAQEHIRALDEKMPRVRVVVPAPVAPGLEVRRDGELLGPAQWGTAVPIDPGTHAFDARAPGKQPWHDSLAVAEGHGNYEVDVPPLKDAAPAPVVPPPAAAPSPSPPPAAPPPAPAPPVEPATSSESGALRATAYVTGGVALVALGIASGFAISASSKWSSAHSACPDDRCPSTADVSEGSTAGSQADVASAMFAVGGASAAVSIILFLASGQHDHPRTGSLHVTPMVGQGTGLVLGGSL